MRKQQREAKRASAAPVSEEVDLGELKYIRVGHIDQGRLCDRLAKLASRMLDGESMPSRWKMVSPEEFVEEFGPGSFWSKTQSYHLFIHDGVPVFRLWTNTKASFVWVDINDKVADTFVRMNMSVENISAGNLRKCRPLTKRFAATKDDHIAFLVGIVRYLYGLDK